MPLSRPPEVGSSSDRGFTLGALSLPLGPLPLREASCQALKRGSPVEGGLQGGLEAAPSPVEPWERRAAHPAPHEAGLRPGPTHCATALLL